MKTFIIFISLAFLLPSLYAKSWHFKSIHIKADVNPDGSMHIIEHRTYDFSGKFSWADYQLAGLENQKILNFKLSDNNGTYLENSSADAGTYYTERVANQFYCKWYYRAHSEIRTFKLEYTISNVIKTYEDVAELYWKFIGESNPANVDTVSIVIALPQAATFGDVKAWAHGPLWGNITFSHNHIWLGVKDLPQDQYVEARVIFPPRWVPQSPVMGGLMQAKIQSQEKEFAEQANRQREQAIIDQEKKVENNTRAYDIAMPMGVAVIFLFIFLYWRYGRGFEVNYTQRTDPNIPDDKHPALLNCIYFGNRVSGSTLSTTLFALAQKEILSIKKDEEHVKKWYDSADRVIIEVNRAKWQEKKNTLQDFETDLLDFLFDTVAKGEDQVTTKQMKKASSKMQKWFGRWTKIIKEHLKETPYFDRESIKGAIINAAVSFILMVISIFIIVNLGQNGLYAFLPAAITLILSATILRFTPETKLLKKKLAALRRYLKTLDSLASQHETTHSISDYFLFAIALAIGKKYTQNILNDIPMEQQAVLFPWFIYGGSGSPADFATTINSVVTAAAGSVSSAAGAGGGMSGGAGAGGGGAAGGAG